MEILTAICVSGIVMLMITRRRFEVRIEKDIREQREHINKCMAELYDSTNAFFSAMQDIDRDNREKLEAVILMLMEYAKEEK